jgi:hypothetical protein
MCHSLSWINRLIQYSNLIAVRDAELAEANQSQPLADTLPKAPHSVSTDPKYPDALIKRPPNTHGKKPKAVSATVKEKITGGKASAPASVAVNRTSGRDESLGYSFFSPHRVRV